MEIDLDEELDESWIKKFEEIDNDYKIFYTEDISFIKLHYIYVNINNEIEKITQDKIILQNPGVLLKEELLGIIKDQTFLNGLKYSLLSILKFDINLEPNHLNTFLKNKNKNMGNYFLQSIKNLGSIYFEKSIAMFHDINDIIIIFHKKNIKERLFTKKIYINSKPNKKTKKIT